jgi:phosphate-selective porin O/P
MSAGRRMAVRRPDVTMAEPGMPVRPTSAGSLVFVWTLAMLAAGGGVAGAKTDPKDGAKNATEVDEETAPEPKVEATPPDAEAKPEVKLAAAPPAGGDAIVVPGPTDTVGFSDHLFVRSPGGEVIVFPRALVQIDGAAFPRQTPKSGVFIRRARVGLSGWLGRIFYFDASAEFAPSPPDGGEPLAPSVLPATDNYVALAPFGYRFMLQAGQFDVPFTLENRTADAYTMFIERSMTARSLGAPRNKEVGVMLHGLLGDGVFYYSGGIFNGDGPDFRNLDNQPDAIGRIALSPLAGSEGIFRRLSVGGSAWYGRHVLGPTFPVQATPGGVRFLAPRWVTGQPARTLEMREHGTVAAFGGELTIPFGTHFGVRGEGVYKRQQLAEVDVTSSTGPVTALGSATLDGVSGYGELWLWLAGDDRMLPTPGLELPLRIEGRYRRAFEDGLMLAIRGEFLKEDLVSNQPALGNPTRATTRVISGTAGVNYWRGAFARISINYVANMWSGTSETIKGLRAQGLLEHELLLRFAISL